MDDRTQIALIERVLAHLEQRTTPMGQDMVRVDTARYHDPARHERELAAIFRGSPLAVGHASQVREPGEFFTHDLIGGAPLLIARDRDGRLGAFLNVCRHRGTRVVDEPCGLGRKSFVCPYHGWTYGTDGRLLGVPHEHGFPGLDRQAHGLVPVAVAEVGGFIWVHLAAGAQAGAIAAFVGPLAAELDGFELASHHIHQTRSWQRRVNWKLAMDTFGEAYHVKVAHRDSLYSMFPDNLGLMDELAPHFRNLAPKRSIATLAGTDPATWRLRDHANLVYVFFPNTVLLFEPRHLTAIHFYPRGPQACWMHSYTLVPERDDSDRAGRFRDASNALLHQVFEEDFARAESIQAGLASGANRELVFGRFEYALARFHRSVDRYLEVYR
jgi:phenylpropionate dioxygenase-like ring-hydroxylating dioxygenase large terminal subunit